ncbi:hypothetical protein PTI98_006042 [Pleurotus ostreatus]|nr:hypothetical protein PTI98_006042 [Pleurotus ostreatus]
MINILEDHLSSLVGYFHIGHWASVLPHMEGVRVQKPGKTVGGAHGTQTPLELEQSPPTLPSSPSETPGKNEANDNLSKYIEEVRMETDLVLDLGAKKVKDDPKQAR